MYVHSKFERKKAENFKVMDFNQTFQDTILLTGILFDKKTNPDFNPLNYSSNIQAFLSETEVLQFDFINIMMVCHNYVLENSRPDSIKSLKDQAENGWWLDVSVREDFHLESSKNPSYVYLHESITQYGNKWCTTNFDQFISRENEGISSAYFLITDNDENYRFSLNESHNSVVSYPFIGMVYKEENIINVLGDEIGQALSVEALPILVEKIISLGLQDSDLGGILIRANSLMNCVIEKTLNTSEVIELTDEELKFVYNKDFLIKKKTFFTIIREYLISLRAKNSLVEEDFNRLLKHKVDPKKAAIIDIDLIINSDSLQELERVLNLNIVKIRSLEGNSVDFNNQSLSIKNIRATKIQSIKLQNCRNLIGFNCAEFSSISLKGCLNVDNPKK